MNRCWFLLSLALFAAAPASAQTKPFWAARVNWFSENYGKVIATLERDAGFMALPVVEAVCEIWSRRGGATGAEVAPAVARALIHHPTLTLSWFHDRPEDFQAWLDRMPYDLLTDYSGEQSDELEAIRVQLANALSEYAAEEENADMASMARAVASVAANSTVSEVD